MRVAEDHLAILSTALIVGSCLRLPGQVDRKTYVALDKVLTAAGGKWDRKAQGHVFDGDAADAIEPILLTGEVQRVKQDFGQFDTPEHIVRWMIDAAGVCPGLDVLEPSAGIGNIVRGIVAAGAVPHAFEIDSRRAAILESSGLMEFPVVKGDFLTAEPWPAFDRVVMNPPFARQADIDHVLHAAKFLKSGGRLVAIMSAGVSFRGDGKATAFRAFVAHLGGVIEPLPAGSFNSAGTSVSTVLVSFDAPAARLNAKGA